MIKIVLAKNYQAISIKFSNISLEIQKQNSQIILRNTEEELQKIFPELYPNELR